MCVPGVRSEGRQAMLQVVWLPKTSCGVFALQGFRHLCYLTCTAAASRHLCWRHSNMFIHLLHLLRRSKSCVDWRCPAGEEINQLQWSPTQPDWVAICFGNKTQILRV